jgi:hypothetical protein
MDCGIDLIPIHVNLELDWCKRIRPKQEDKRMLGRGRDWRRSVL